MSCSTPCGPMAPRKNPQNVMWVNVSKLRSAIDPDRPKGSDSTVLVTQAPGYMLVTDADAIDAARFEKLASEGRALVDVDPAAASLVFNEALALWNGRALEEFTYDEFAQPEIARLEELRLTTVEHRVDADLQVGLAHELVGELEGLTRLHPLRERLAAQLMIALHRTGRQGEALRGVRHLPNNARGRVGARPVHRPGRPGGADRPGRSVPAALGAGPGARRRAGGRPNRSAATNCAPASATDRTASSTSPISRPWDARWR